VEIEAKFVEITQQNLKELSFSWLLGQANVGSSNGVFLGGGTSGTSPAIDPNDYGFVAAGWHTDRRSSQSLLETAAGNLAISQNAIDALLFGTSGRFTDGSGSASRWPVSSPILPFSGRRALNQKKGVDLLSAPRVTTKSGQRAVIEIIREFRTRRSSTRRKFRRTWQSGRAELFSLNPLNPLQKTRAAAPAISRSHRRRQRRSKPAIRV
jgi:general secretion pathway protein D